MAILDYTDAKQIRGVLGVDVTDYSDEDVLLKVYEQGLEEDLADVNVDLADQFVVVVALVEADRSKAQQRFVGRAQQFATYSIARQVAVGLPMKAPKSLGDGQATASRFSDGPYKDVIKGLGQSFDRSRERLLDAYEAMTASTRIQTVRTLFSVASPTEDPITGAGY